MSRRNGLMSEALKYEFAKELGIVPSAAAGDYNTEFSSELGMNGGGQQSIDWGSVTSRDCGNMVKMAIEMAERNLSSNSLE